LDPTAAACSPAARWGTGRQTSDRDVKLGSPAIDWWRRIGLEVAGERRRRRRRDGAAAGARTTVKRGVMLNKVLH
jgi:hypothetical protein